jgi:hypothetical protein
MSSPSWEYTVTSLDPHAAPSTLLMHLNDLGSRGWELVTCEFALLIWKRPTPMAVTFNVELPPEPEPEPEPEPDA